MFEKKNVEKILYGGDYNPEQWPEDVWQEDMRLLKQAGMDIVTLNVFSWALLQSSEEEYHFEELDKIMELVQDHGMKVCMATSTAVHPAWMARKYPDVLRVDFEGRKRKFGGRANSCPNSPTYRKYSRILAGKLAKRYRDYDNIVAWHISNEYSGACYCENCEKNFRLWLQKKYHTLDNLNQSWNTAFWGHTFYDWEEIVAPDMRSEHFAEDRTYFQPISLDYRRFMSDSMLECYTLEYDAIKEVIPDAEITTNLMDFYKTLDYFRWAKKMDFVSWDCYPENGQPYARTSMAHDLMRGLKGGQSFALMEQTPTVSNWLPYNALKRPGVMRLLSYQAVAHGADTVMFFQMRQSAGACEKFHGAVIGHAGTPETRVFKEIAALGKELKTLGASTLGMRTRSKIAMLFDWDNWWGIEFSAGPTKELDYMAEFTRYYSALRNRNYNVDIVSPEDSLEPYALVIAPVYYMVKGDNDERIRRFVRRGGTFLTTFFSGMVQENDLVTLGGYPGKLRDILGIWVEEEDALPPEQDNAFCYRGKTYPARILCDLLHTETAEQIDEKGYLSDFYQGFPVLTRNRMGEGCAYFVATSSGDDFYRDFLRDLCDECHISPVLTTPEGVEVTSRCREEDGKEILFVLNHNERPETITLPRDCTDLLAGIQIPAGEVTLEGYDVKILSFQTSEA